MSSKSLTWCELLHSHLEFWNSHGVSFIGVWRSYEQGRAGQKSLVPSHCGQHPQCPVSVILLEDIAWDSESLDTAPSTRVQSGQGPWISLLLLQCALPGPHLASRFYSGARLWIIVTLLSSPRLQDLKPEVNKQSAPWRSPCLDLLVNVLVIVSSLLVNLAMPQPNFFNCKF